jgi:prepilin-type N-terminal cleavage/methylation domain-containing protein
VTNRHRRPRGTGRRGSACRPSVMVRRGLTLLEVVFAVALLAVVAATATSVLGFVAAAQLRERQRLAATEVAHRLVLNYLDDPTEMPDPSRPVEYGPPEAPARFRWDYTDEKVRLIEVAGDRRIQRQGPLNPDRFRQVTVRAWLSEESGGSRFPEGNTPIAVVSRMIDPIAARNPDSYMNMIRNPRYLERMMQEFMGFSGPAGGAPASPGGGVEQPTGGGRIGTVERRGGAAEAFRRGATGTGGQRVPLGESGINVPRSGGSWNPVDAVDAPGLDRRAR